MKKTFCDYCGKKFSDRDHYVDASIGIKYTLYNGDDGSEFVNLQNDLCEDCLGKIIGFLGKLKKGSK